MARKRKIASLEDTESLAPKKQRLEQMNEPIHIKEVLDSITSRWKQFVDEKKCVLNSPATNEELAAFESSFNIELPEEFVFLFKRHNGQDSSYGLKENHVGLYGDAMIFLSLSAMTEITEEDEENLEELSEVPEGFKYEKGIIFSYSYQEEHSNCYILRCFKDDNGQFFYDIDIRNLQCDPESFGYGLGSKMEDNPPMPKTNTFLHWLIAYDNFLKEHSDNSILTEFPGDDEFSDYIHDLASVKGVYQFHINYSFPSATAKSANK